MLVPDDIIFVWPWRNAPEQYRALSTHGGDEDWVVFVAKQLDGWNPFYFAEGTGYLMGFGHEETHRLEDGSVVYIYAHA